MKEQNIRQTMPEKNSGQLSPELCSLGRKLSSSYDIFLYKWH